MCQLSETVTISATLHETISRDDTPIATVAYNISSNVAPCARALRDKKA